MIGYCRKYKSTNEDINKRIHSLQEQTGRLKTRSSVDKVYVSVNCDSKESIMTRDLKKNPLALELNGMDGNMQGNYIIMGVYLMNIKLFFRFNRVSLDRHKGLFSYNWFGWTAKWFRWFGIFFKVWYKQKEKKKKTILIVLYPIGNFLILKKILIDNLPHTNHTKTIHCAETIESSEKFLSIFNGRSNPYHRTK